MALGSHGAMTKSSKHLDIHSDEHTSDTNEDDGGGSRTGSSSSSDGYSSANTATKTKEQDLFFYERWNREISGIRNKVDKKLQQFVESSQQELDALSATVTGIVSQPMLQEKTSTSISVGVGPKIPTRKIKVTDEFECVLPLSPANRKTQAKKRSTSLSSRSPKNRVSGLLATPSSMRSYGSSVPPINSVMSKASSKASKASDKTELAHNLSKRRARSLQRLRKNEAVLKAVNEENEYKRSDVKGGEKQTSNRDDAILSITAKSIPSTCETTDDEPGPAASIGGRHHDQIVGREYYSVTVGPKNQALSLHELHEVNESPFVQPERKCDDAAVMQGNGEISKSSSGHDIRKTDSNQSQKSSRTRNTNGVTDAISVARSERDHRDARLALEDHCQSSSLSKRRRKYFFPSASSTSSSEKNQSSTASDSAASTKAEDETASITSGTAKTQQTENSSVGDSTKSPVPRSRPRIVTKKSFASAHSSSRPALSPVAESSIESPRNFWLQREREALQQQAKKSVVESMPGTTELSLLNLSSTHTSESQSIPETVEAKVYLLASTAATDSASKLKEHQPARDLISKVAEKNKFQRERFGESSLLTVPSVRPTESAFVAAQPRNIQPALNKKVQRVRSAESSKISSSDTGMDQEWIERASVHENPPPQISTPPLNQQQGTQKESERATPNDQSFNPSRAPVVSKEKSHQQSRSTATFDSQQAVWTENAALMDQSLILSNGIKSLQCKSTGALALEHESVLRLEQDAMMQKINSTTRLVTQRHAAPKPETFFHKHRQTESNGQIAHSVKRAEKLLADYELSQGSQNKSNTSNRIGAEPPTREFVPNIVAAFTPEEPPSSSEFYSLSTTFFTREKKNDAPTGDDLVIEDVKRPDAPEVGEPVMSPSSTKFSGPGTLLSPANQSISGTLSITSPTQDSVSINSGNKQSFSERSTEILSVSTSGNTKHKWLEQTDPEMQPAALSLASPMANSSLGACSSKALGPTPSSVFLSPTSSARSVLLGSDQSKSDQVSRAASSFRSSLMDTNDSTPIHTNGGNQSSLASSSLYPSLQINTNPSPNDYLPATSSITTAVHHFLDPRPDLDDDDNGRDWTRFEYSPELESPLSTRSIAPTPTPRQERPESSSTTASNMHRRLQLDLSGLDDADMSHQSKVTTSQTVSTLSSSHMNSHNHHQPSSLGSPEEKRTSGQGSKSVSGTVCEELPYYFGDGNEEKKEEEETVLSASAEQYNDDDDEVDEEDDDDENDYDDENDDDEDNNDEDNDELIVRMQHVKNKHLHDPYGDAGLYTGVLIQGQPDSYGIMEYEDGRVYTGSWKRGRWDGHGKTIFTNGDCYTGEYVNDTRQGIGRYEWLDGRIYDGRFEADQRQGTGIYSWPDGSVYSGEFHRGLRHGHGTYTFTDGSVYNGAWKNGKQHGIGECVWKDGRCYRGEWENGKAHGYGVEVRADGTTRYDGLWKHDRPVKVKNKNRVEEQVKRSTLWNIYSSAVGGKTAMEPIKQGKEGTAASASSHQRRGRTDPSTSPDDEAEENRSCPSSTENQNPFKELITGSPHHYRATTHGSFSSS